MPDGSFLTTGHTNGPGSVVLTVSCAMGTDCALAPAIVATLNVPPRNARLIMLPSRSRWVRGNPSTCLPTASGWREWAVVHHSKFGRPTSAQGLNSCREQMQHRAY